MPITRVELLVFERNSPTRAAEQQRESKEMKKFLWSVLGVGALLVSAQVAYTATTGSQQYTVTVGKNVNIVAPTEPMSKTYTVADLDADAAEATADVDDYDFPVQAWTAKGNVKNGVKVDFEMAPFANLDYPAVAPATGYEVYNDGELTITKTAERGPATWTAGTSRVSTNYASANPLLVNAVASYTSDKVGQADFGVTVTFLATDINSVVEGEYVTQVTGTITEN